MSDPALLRATDLGCRFELRRSRGPGGGRQQVQAVRDVNLALAAGESVGLVGESGCGKTTLSRLLLGLTAPTSGTVRFRGRNLAELSRAEYLDYRQSIQPVFQDPFAALDPRMRVGRIVAEPLRADNSLTESERTARVARALEQVELEPADAARYPHEFSGGQRQRIAIARALAVNPALIVFDEAVSSQDVSIRAQILNLLRDIRERSGVAYLFISHDLSNVRFLCDRVCVMYLGRIVEQAPTSELFAAPQHPYTQALLGAWLPPDPTAARQPLALAGEVPSATRPPSGCAFHPRCPQVMPQCREVEPPFGPIGAAARAGSGSGSGSESQSQSQSDTEVACHLYPPPK